MNIILTRRDFREDGIFGELFDNNHKFLYVTLEHSYDFQPKLKKGDYLCKRTTHQLNDGIPFETFQVLGIKDCEDIFFHTGNFNGNSNGSILIGSQIGNTIKPGGWMITGSMQAFKQFMELQNGVDEFILTVIK